LAFTPRSDGLAGGTAGTGVASSSRFPPAGWGEQRTALLCTIRLRSRSLTVAATHLSNKQGHNVCQLRELQDVSAARAGGRRACWWAT
jgi:hypothetical protein